MQHNETGREPTEPTDAELLNNVRRMFRCAIFLAEADERWGGTAKRTPADRSAWEDRERWLLRLVDRVKTVTPELDANISDRLRIDPADLSGQRPMPDTPAPDEVAGWRMTPEQFEAEIERQAAEIKRLEEDRDGWARAHHEIGSACEFTANKNTALSARVAELEAGLRMFLEAGLGSSTDVVQQRAAVFNAAKLLTAPTHTAPGGEGGGK